MIRFVLPFLFSFQAYAYNCPSYLESHPDAQKAYEWLLRFEGTRELAGCHLEIVVCDPSATPKHYSPLAEVYIKTPEGRDVYLAVDFTDSDEITSELITNSRTFHYLKRDRYYETVEGRTEVWRLEIRTLWGDKSELDLAELGVYTTNRQLNQANGNDSRWYVCNRE